MKLAYWRTTPTRHVYLPSNVELNAFVHRQLGLKSNPQITPEYTKSVQLRGPATSLQNYSKRDSSRKNTIEYNKWYIDPKLRYLRREDNPKSNIRAYASKYAATQTKNSSTATSTTSTSGIGSTRSIKSKANSTSRVRRRRRCKPTSCRRTRETCVCSRNSEGTAMYDYRKLGGNQARLPLIVKEMLETQH